MSVPPKDLFLHSLERCKVNEDFIKAFYEQFISSSEEVANKFRKTDFEHQNNMLLKSLETAAHAVAGDGEALKRLHAQAERHSRYDLNIQPELYDLWLTSIVETASHFDPYWNQTVEKAWRKVLAHVIHHMTSKY